MAGDVYWAGSSFIGQPEGLLCQRQRIAQLRVDSGGDHRRVDAAIKHGLAIKLGTAMGNDDFLCIDVEVDNALISAPRVTTGQDFVLCSADGDVGTDGRKRVHIDIVRERRAFSGIHCGPPSIRVETSIGKYSSRFSGGIFSYQLEGSVGVRSVDCPVVKGGNARFTYAVKVLPPSISVKSAATDARIGRSSMMKANEASTSTGVQVHGPRP